MAAIATLRGAAGRCGLSDTEWARLRPLMPDRSCTGRPPKDHRVVLDALLWLARTGAPWRDLPECFGPWRSIATRFYRWTRSGLWDRIRADRLGRARGGRDQRPRPPPRGRRKGGQHLQALGPSRPGRGSRELAEAEGHHPDIAFGWGHAAVSLRTRKIGGLHENDFIAGAKLDRLADDPVTGAARQGG
jgi:transposase